MSLAETLLQPALWLGTFGFAIGCLIVIPLGYITEARLPSPLLRWQWEHVAMPLLRILLLLLFIVLTYPELYGLKTAPPLSGIISFENGTTSDLINLLFVLSVLLPLIPVIGEWQALTLPLQGVTAVALIFSWMPDHQAPLSCYWPGVITILVLLALVWISFRAALLLGERIGHWFDRQYHVIDSHEMIGNTLLLILQSPLVVIYAHSLGNCAPPV